MRGEVRPLPTFEYFAPETLSEVLSLLHEYGDEACLLAGGTDLLLQMKLRNLSPGVIVDVNRVPELSFIEMRETELYIGATTCLNAIKASPVVQAQAAALGEAIGYLASQPLRNRATIGGNLCNASRAADTAPPLLALNASVTLQSEDGERSVALADFFTGSGRTVRRGDEVLREVVIPCQGCRSTSMALGSRQGFSCTIASTAVAVVISGGIFTDVRVALGAVNATPTRSPTVEQTLIGMEVSAAHIDQALRLIEADVQPVSDVLASAAYRRAMARVLTRRALKKVALGGDTWR